MTDELVVEVGSSTLVGAWSTDWLDRRTSFHRRVTSYLSLMPSGSRMGLRYRRRSQFVEVLVGIAGPAVVAQTAEDLYQLLSDSDSPVAVSRSDIYTGGRRRQTPAPPDFVFRIDAPRFRGNARSRSHAIDLVPTADTLEELVSAVLAADHVEYRALLVATGGGIDELHSHMSHANLKEPTNSELGYELANKGLPVRLEACICAKEAILEPRVMAAVSRLVPGAQFAKIDLDRRVSSYLARWEPFTDADSMDVTGSVTEDGACSLFRLPAARRASFPGMTVKPQQVVRAPTLILQSSSMDSVRLGSSTGPTGQEIDANLSQSDFSRHMYVPGQTGSGKSTFLRSLACGVASTGDGMLVIDPHGETVEQLIEELPRGREADVVVVDAADIVNSAPINPFAVSDPLQRDTALENVTSMFVDLFDPHQQGIVGPRWESWFRMGMLTLIAAHGERASMLDVPKLFIDNNYLAICKDSLEPDGVVRDFWDKEMAKISDYHKSEVLGWFTSKFAAFRTNSVLNAVLGTGMDVLRPEEAMDEGKIILVSLRKGDIGEPVATLLGYVYLTRFWTAALKRRSGRPFSVFVDEAQTFTKGSLPSMLAEGRKFGLRLVMANQYLDQLPEDLQSSIVGNVGNLVALRLGDDDAKRLSGRFAPEFTQDGLRRLPNFEAAASLLAGGAVMPGFSLLVDHESRLRAAGRASRVRRRVVESQSRRVLSRLRTEAKDLAVADERVEVRFAGPAGGSDLDPKGVLVASAATHRSGGEAPVTAEVKAVQRPEDRTDPSESLMSSWRNRKAKNGSSG